VSVFSGAANVLDPEASGACYFSLSPRPCSCNHPGSTTFCLVHAMGAFVFASVPEIVFSGGAVATPRGFRVALLLRVRVRLGPYSFLLTFRRLRSGALWPVVRVFCLRRVLLCVRRWPVAELGSAMTVVFCFLSSASYISVLMVAGVLCPLGLAQSYLCVIFSSVAVLVRRCGSGVFCLLWSWSSIAVQVFVFVSRGAQLLCGLVVLFSLSYLYTDRRASYLLLVVCLVISFVSYVAGYLWVATFFMTGGTVCCLGPCSSGSDFSDFGKAGDFSAVSCSSF